MIPTDDLRRGRFAVMGAIFVALGLIVLGMLACPSFAHAQTPTRPLGTSAVSEREKPSDPNGGAHRALYFAVATANAADLWTTKRAFATGGHEANPLLGSGYPRIVVTKTLITAGIIGCAEWLQKKGHGRIARILLWADVSAMSFAAAHNAREGR